MKLLLFLALTLCPAGANVSDEVTTIEQGFTNPPRDARPRVWWHWMNGNITKDGLRKDIEWMDRAGVGGFHVFDAGLDTPQIVESRIPYMTPEWKDAFNFALDIAERHDMEVTFASSPGWSVTGGPWVSMDDAMKTLNWREITVKGGRRWRGALPEGYEVCGKYLSHHIYPDNQNPERYNYYRDIAVVAVKLPDADKSMAEMGAVLSASDGADASSLVDGDLMHPLMTAPGPDGSAWVKITFPGPQTIKAFTTCGPDDGLPRYGFVFECSDDDVTYRTVQAKLPDTTTPFLTCDVPAATAKYFRFRQTAEGKGLDFTEISLHGVTKVNVSQEKSGFFASGSLRDFHPTPATTDAIPFADVVDITEHFKDGVLDWKVPAGRWKIYRFGYNLRGKHNYPASPEATGLEVDKFDKDAVRRYFTNYFALYNEASHGRLGSTISHLMIDSFEAGCQTWTAKMPEEFASRRGYDLIRWLPALAGDVLGSSEDTERFLCDWRGTLGELMTENHYDAAGEITHEYGMKRHTESHEAGRAYVVDGMDVKRNADIPMAAFWMQNGYGINDVNSMDIRESASVAHLYGQQLVAAESFTAHGERFTPWGQNGWAFWPGNLKSAADGAMASGLTRFVIHCSTHQPVDDKIPGLGLGVYGQWFHRHETWAEEARSWTDYLARSTWMLRQGQFVADIAYYYGETTNITCRFKADLPYIPEGYDYDFVNKTALLKDLRIEGRELVAPSGARYKALMIDNFAQYMSVDVLRRICEIVDAGVLVAGEEPLTRCDLQGSESEFRDMIRHIWHSGLPNVCSFANLGRRLGEAGIAPAVTFRNPDSAPIRFVQRRLDGGAELFWVTNSAPEGRDVEFSFNVSGRKPVILHADTGVIEDASYRFEGTRTVVPVHFVRDDAQFILFAEPTDVSSYSAPASVAASETAINGPWTVRFQQGRGAPESAVFETLASLSESSDPGIRYFSGTAAYSCSFDWPAKPVSKAVLDLGAVYNMARVRVNGKDMGLVWKEPFTLDITSALTEGSNTIEVEVTCSWVNRLIGDLQPGVTDPVTYVAVKHYTADSPLRDAGLAGPVKIIKYNQN